ncbi:transketolase, partial [bacterium]|nr:transketolase [bacterium]
MPHVEELAKISIKLRENVIKMLEEAGTGHSAGSLGTAEIFSTLYFHVLNIDPKNPNDPNRDRFVLSAGHICPVYYAALAEKGYFPETDLWKLRKINSPLQGHPDRTKTPGVDASSGSLGQGLSQAIGMAISAKLDNLHHRIYCLTSDGELNEGQIWEAAMFA